MIKNKNKHVDNVDKGVDNSQIVHTPMGTTIEPAKFQNGDRVTTTQTLDTDNVEIPEGIVLCVSGIIGDDMYSLIGPNNLKFKLNGAYLEKVKEDKNERIC